MRMIQVYELNEQQQDILWSDECPYCGSKIIETVRTVDYAYWVCSRCDIIFNCE
jgi:ribosomal protein L37AE/L43A